MAAAKVTAADLSRATGAKEPSISKWVNGQTLNLKGKNLVASAALLNVSEAWLAHGVGPKARNDSNWPFRLISETKVRALDERQLAMIEMALALDADKYGIDIRADITDQEDIAIAGRHGSHAAAR